MHHARPTPIVVCWVQVDLRVSSRDLEIEMGGKKFMVSQCTALHAPAPVHCHLC